MNLTARSLPPRERSCVHMSQHLKSFKDTMIAINKKNILSGNFQDTSFLSIIGKTLAGILLDQLLLNDGNCVLPE